MRYYYTDPLAMACMAKYFGMKFVDYNLSAPEIHVLPFVDAERKLRLSIHTDSLPILEPQVGDVAQYWITTAPDYFSQSTAKKTKEHVKRITKHLMFYIKHQAGMSNFRIIQRYGKPFFWPESEEE